MPTLRYDSTLTAPFAAFGADILWMGVSGTSVWVLAGDPMTLRLIELSQADLSSLGSTTIAGQAGQTLQADIGAHTIDVSGELFALAGGMPQQVLAYDGDTSLAADQIKLARVSIAGTDLAILTHPDRAGFSLLKVSGSTLSIVDQAAMPSSGAISDLAIIAGYGADWLVTLDHTNDALTTWQIGPSGIDQIATFGATDGLGINTPTAAATLTLFGQPYIVVASALSNSVSLVRIEADGSMTATDHILDDLGTRFAAPSQLGVMQAGGVSLVAIAGNDDGLTLLRILGDGTFLHMGTMVHQTGWTLNNPSALAIWASGTDLKLVVASSTDAGLTQFSMDISTLGPEIWGTVGPDVLAGSTGDDVLLASDGDDSVTGASGDDTLRDGAGADTLTGGSGADCFQIVLDGQTDRITDFDRTEDWLDFSHYPLAHDITALTILPTSWGAVVTLRGDTLEVYSKNGSSLAASDLTKRNPFPLDRPPLVLSPGGSGANGPQIQVGSNGNDILIGDLTDDILTGNAGDDTLIGGAGGDQLLGGAGYDRVSYQNAVSAIVLNLAQPSKNTSDAAGDVFASIEIFEGSGFADTLSGNGSHNAFDGAIGNDWIVGLGGNDTLIGGPGDDTLVGGSGADELDGGVGWDITDYSGSKNGLVVDLGFTLRNSGDAKGDIFILIEALVGSAFDDQIAGDDSANRLDGGSGDDRLIGRNGADILAGGGGHDILRGGAGDDALIGGSGRDLADFVDLKSGVSANLATGSATSGASVDSLSGIEDLAGTLFDDSLTGSNGANHLIGLDGNDTLHGLGGADTLSGGDGSDVFRFDLGFDQDRIADFAANDDVLMIDLKLTGGLTDPKTLLAQYATSAASFVSLDFGNGDQIILDNLSDTDDLIDSFLFF